MLLLLRLLPDESANMKLLVNTLLESSTKKSYKNFAPDYVY